MKTTVHIVIDGQQFKEFYCDLPVRENVKEFVDFVERRKGRVDRMVEQLKFECGLVLTGAGHYQVWLCAQSKIHELKISDEEMEDFEKQILR